MKQSTFISKTGRAILESDLKQEGAERSWNVGKLLHVVFSHTCGAVLTCFVSNSWPVLQIKVKRSRS